MSSCICTNFENVALFGANVLSIQATPVIDYSFPVPDGWRFSQPSVDVTNATFCNVTVTYTHSGLSDKIQSEIWLPDIDTWNGRLQSIGGGGWAAGRFALSYAGMAGAIFDGYATATTDAGLGDSLSPGTWGLVSPGNLNQVAFDNFGERSLGDLASLSKEVIKRYYGKEPSYSYWNGCSNGGRQAEILAQRYPTAYNGIIAAAPGLYWSELAMSSVWPAFYMDLTQQYPEICELEKLTALAIDKCDGLDDIQDGLITDTEQCMAVFKAQDYLDTDFYCPEKGSSISMSIAAVNVAEAIWKGPTYSNGDMMWYGYDIGTNLSTLAATSCTPDGGCVPESRASLQFWWQLFVLKDLSANVTTFTHAQFDQLYLTLKAELAAVDARESRISQFQNAGGRMITFHGLADPAIPPQSTLHYYQEVSRTLNNTANFYRYYRVPGLEHCWGGSGGQPVHLFDQLRSWVENGTAPDESLVTVQLPNNTSHDEILCPYPRKPSYKQSCSSKNDSAACWSCV